MTLGISFRPLSAADLPLLYEWQRRAHVAQWWADPGTLESLAEDYLTDLDAPDATRAFIAWRNEQPLGFIQCYVVAGSGGGWWEDETDPGARGIDQFLADGSRLGQGLGSAMIHAFLGQLFADPRVTKVQTDPSPDNERAIRAYRRAGFAPVRELMTPDGPALLMLCDRTSWATARLARAG